MTDTTTCELCEAEVAIPCLVLVGMQTMFVCNSCEDVLYEADPEGMEAFGAQVFAAAVSSSVN